jgi:hypothetical protein
VLEFLRSASTRSHLRQVPSLLCAVALSAGVGCGRIGVEVQTSAQEGADAASDEADADLDASLIDERAADASAEDAATRDEASAPDADSTLDSASTLDAAGSDAMSGLDGGSGDATSAADAGMCATSPSTYVSDARCGVGYCRLHNTPSRCANGTEIACSPAAPRSASDSSCDGVDDDCDGNVDEDYVAASTSCGRGVCARSGTARCIEGALRDSCLAAEPTTNSDDTTALGNGLDDDCDGQVDEDIPGCDTAPRAFEAGDHTNVAVPPGCGRVTVRLWGAGGASGGDLGIEGMAGDGGAGGYASLTTRISGALSLLIGEGGGSGCDAAGVNAGSADYNGGSGGSSTGAPGADGMVPEGGASGAPSAGYAGGRGHFGGGGGGQGSGGLGASGNGGGGGAASVFIMNGVRLVVAGGGGGGGGAQSVSFFGTFLDAGGNGGGGCAGIGQVESGGGGGGGGGGVCDGFATHLGTGVTPAFSDDIPAGLARGAEGSCAAGGAGYAIVTFSR